MIYVAPTSFPTLPGEISIIASRLQAESFGAITRREAIDRARAILAGVAQ